MADLSHKFFLPAVVMTELIQRGRSVATLNQEAVEFLQFRLGIMYSRRAREDYDWPSLADLEARKLYLQAQIKNNQGVVKGAKRNHAEATDPDRKEGFQAAIDFGEHQIAGWEQDLQRCNQAIEKQNADAATQGNSVVASTAVQKPHEQGGPHGTAPSEGVRAS